MDEQEENKDQSMKILEMRYSKGELTEKQYNEAKAAINSGTATASNADIAAREAIKRAERANAMKSIQSVRKSTMLLVFFFLLLVLYLAYSLIYPNVTPKPTIYITNVSQKLFAVGPVTPQLTKPLPSCAPRCVDVLWNNFTIPDNATKIRLTGAYSSQYPIVFALLNPVQFKRFLQVNSSDIFNNNTYLVFNKNATLDVPMAPGAYSLVFYYPGSSIDTLTVTQLIKLNYTLFSMSRPNATTST